MPNNPHALSWTTEEFDKLVELVKPHSFLYNVQDPSRKNILARESTWEQISRELNKPAEDCKKRWRAIRDGYMATKRMGSNKAKTGLSTKLEFLSEPLDEAQIEDQHKIELAEEETEQQVIMDTQEYYEITLVDSPETAKISHKLPLPPQVIIGEPPKKIGRRNCGRKKYQPPPPPCLQPIKILPKPVVMNRPNIMYVEETPKVPTPPRAQKSSEALESLVEKLLKEHTNEIDVFFRSMAASVKKLQPNLIPKVKMEVCNVIAKYEMQSFEKKGST